MNTDFDDYDDVSKPRTAILIDHRVARALRDFIIEIEDDAGSVEERPLVKLCDAEDAIDGTADDRLKRVIQKSVPNRFPGWESDSAGHDWGLVDHSEWFELVLTEKARCVRLTDAGEASIDRDNFASRPSDGPEPAEESNGVSLSAD